MLNVLLLGCLFPISAEAEPEAAARPIVRFDIPYAETDNPRQTLDLVLPANRAKGVKSPLVVFIHGGGWRGGNKLSGRRFLPPVVANGEYIGASIGYRLSGEAKWPAQIHDCKAAIRFLRGNAEKYGIDPDRIAVMGTSAGGHLVCMLGTTAGVEEFEGDLGSHDDQSSAVTCVVNFFGPTDLHAMWTAFPKDSPRRKGGPLEQLFGGDRKDIPEKAKAASPVNYVDADDAPFLTIHGTKDPLVPVSQAHLLDAELKKVGVPSMQVIIEGGGHGGLPREKTVPAIKKFLAEHLAEPQAVAE